jgi:2,3-bisphosphoglycerate-independent phosphoglycerate mutase
MIAPTAIIRGIGMTIGIDIFDVEGATGYYDSNFSNKMATAVELITSDKYDFGFVHIKAVDDAGHDKNPDLKVRDYVKIV